MRPLIAITLRSTDIKSLPSYYVNNTYTDMLLKSGADYLPVGPKQDPAFYERAAQICTGLLLTGGRDINPIYYGQEVHPETKTEPDCIDQLDFSLIQAFAKAKKPILGICRGAQIINVCFGGTLYQHLPHIPELFCDHKRTDAREKGVHQITWIGETDEFYYKNQTISVNSLHHQGIKEIAPGFDAIGICEDSLVEAIRMGNILGVQWHPEEMTDQTFRCNLLTFFNI